MKANLLNPISTIVVVLIAGLLFTSCKKNATGPVTDPALNSSQDAAESVANALGEDNGGVADQLGDISDATGSAGIQPQSPSVSTADAIAQTTTTAGDTVVKTFNSSDTSWTITVTRSRAGLFGRQAGFTRTYFLKFINKNGVALPSYRTNTIPQDTAYTILFQVLRGSGYNITRRVSSHLLALTSNFVVTNANTSTITVNGTLTRSGTDTVLTLNGQRVLSHSLTMTFTNVTGPRAPRFGMVARVPRATGGTITGTYTATVSVLRGDSYSERSFTKNFTVTFGSGTGSINVNGAHFTCDMMYGEITGN
jgi:hypothetical protein